MRLHASSKSHLPYLLAPLAFLLGWCTRGHSLPTCQSPPVAPDVVSTPSSQPLCPRKVETAEAAREVLPAIPYGHAEWMELPLTERLQRGFALQDVEWKHLLQQWGRKLGAASIEDVQSRYANPQEQTWTLKKLLGGWAEADPAAATAWLNAHTDTNDWDGQLFEVLAGVGRNSVALGTQAALDSLPPGHSWAKEETMKNLAEAAVREGGLTGLRAWFDALPHNDLGVEARSAAFPAVLFRIKHADPAAARQFIQDHQNELTLPNTRK